MQLGRRVGVTLASVFSAIDKDWAVWCAIVRYAGLTEERTELRDCETMKVSLARKD